MASDARAFASAFTTDDKRKFGTAMTDVVFSIVILAAILLVIAAFVYWRRTGAVKQPVLMVVLALVAIGNVLILTIPTKDGAAPIDKIEAANQSDEAGAD